jgi:signal transduction histidine kinase
MARITGNIHAAWSTSRHLRADRDERAFESQSRMMAAQRRFLGDASHELRSPLGNIRGTIEVALRRPRLASQYREALQASHAETMRMCRLVDDLLTLSRTDAGQFAMEFSPCDLSYIARQAATAHAGQELTAEEQAHIFERFFRTDRARSRHSGGLGLAIGAAILEAHRGRLAVDSRFGEGATFSIRVPQMDSDEEAAEDELTAACA